MNWNKYPNFSKKEFDCSHTGANGMQEVFLEKLQALRTEYGKPMNITSGYRHPTHPIEARKGTAGMHSQGLACDIGCWSDEAYKIVELAYKHGFRGIGVSQSPKGARFVHLDLRESSPILYSY